MDVVSHEFTLVTGAIRPREGAAARLVAQHIAAHVLGTVWPHLRALPMLFVFFPLTIVLGAVSMIVHPVAMCLQLPFRAQTENMSTKSLIKSFNRHIQKGYD